MKAVICAAGISKRMGSLTKSRPKPLLSFGKKTIIENVVENLAIDPIEEIIIVTGYLGSQIRKRVGSKVKGKKISYITNKMYKKTSNTYSLCSAKDEVDGGIIFTNADLFHTSKTYRNFICDKRKNLIAVDTRPKYFTHDDPVKVTIRSRKIVAINKSLPREQINGVAVGLYKFSPALTKYFFSIIEDIITKNEPKEGYAVAVRNLIMDKEVEAFYIGGEPWFDIDTPRDYQHAKKQIIKNKWI